MRKDTLVKIEMAVILAVVIIIAVFGKDIAAWVNEQMAAETTSLVDQLLK